MQSMIDTLLSALTDLRANGEMLDAESQLLLSVWEGEAADAYEGRHAGWQADHAYSADELRSAVSALRRVLGRYQDVEAEILDLVT